MNAKLGGCNVIMDPQRMPSFTMKQDFMLFGAPAIHHQWPAQQLHFLIPNGFSASLSGAVADPTVKHQDLASIEPLCMVATVLLGPFVMVWC